VKPIALYDKSFIQSLNLKEAELFGLFFATNIIPTLIREIGADLTKEITQPTKEVSNIAIKLFEPHSYFNIDYRILCVEELCGSTVNMSYKPLVNPTHSSFEEGKGKIGAIFKRSEPVEKIERWAKGEFLSTDYQEASEWRNNFINAIPMLLQTNLNLNNAPKIDTPEEAKDWTVYLMHQFYKNNNRGYMLRYTLDRFGVTAEHRKIIMRRWKDSGGLALVDFAPYTSYVILIELFFSIGISAKAFNFKGWNRPTNFIDLTYLYYLPFTEVFISGDNVHKNLAPLFIDTANQKFIDGNNIKSDLNRLTDYYLNHPDLQRKGLFRLAEYPPLDGNFIICNIYDRFCKGWRNFAANPIPITPKLQEHIKKLAMNIENSELALPQSPLEEKSTLIFKRHIISSEKGWENLIKPNQKISSE